MEKTAISAPTSEIWQQMVHDTTGIEKSAISAPTSEIWQQTVGETMTVTYRS